MDSPNRTVLRKIITHRFGEPQPLNGRVGFEPIPQHRAYIPAHSIPFDRSISSVVQARQFCFAERPGTEYISEEFWPQVNNVNATEIGADEQFEGYEVSGDEPEMTDMEIGVNEQFKVSGHEPEIKMELGENEQFEQFEVLMEAPPSSSNKRETPIPPSASPITLEMIIVNNIIVFGKSENDVIVNDDSFKIKQHELATFTPGRGQWLHDIVVDYYLELITRRNKSRVGYMNANVYSFKSTFYPLLASAKGLKSVEHSADGVNIFNQDLIFFPVCESHHWRLIVVEVKNRLVTAYNSSNSPDKRITNNIVRYLNDEYPRKYPGTEVPEWITAMDLEDLPKQDNADDCGVFMLQFADYVSRSKPFDFGQVHMPYFRARMLYECISNRLLSD